MGDLPRLPGAVGPHLRDATTASGNAGRRSAAGRGGVTSVLADSLVDMTNARGRRDTRVAIEASLLAPLFEAGQVAMLALDPDGTVSAMTPAAEQLLGYGQSELVGQSAHGRLHYQRNDGRTLPSGECPILAALTTSR